jgi:hypothetical protein
MAENKQERLNALRAELEKRKKKLPVSTQEDSAQTKVSTEFVPPVKSPFMPALQGSERPELIKPSEVIEPVTEMVVGAGLPTIGQAVGASTGPFAPIAVPAFGAAGGAISEIINEIRRGEEISPSKILKQSVIGGIPGGGLAKAGGKELAKEAGKILGVTTAASAAGRAMEGKSAIPTPLELGKDILEAGAATAGAKFGAAEKPISKYEQMFVDRDAALTAAKNEGLNVKIPPSMVGGKSPVSLSTIAEQSSIAKAASEHNLYEFQKAARAELGLPTTGRITIRPDEDLALVRERAAVPYQKIDEISKSAKNELNDIIESAGDDAEKLKNILDSDEAKTLSIKAGADVDELKKLRRDAQKAWDAFKSGNPEKFSEWQEASRAAESIEQKIDQVGQLVGDKQLISDLREARKKIAQSYQVESALSDRTTGLLDPNQLAVQFNSGAPLTGKLKAIADFSNAFDRAAVEASTFNRPVSGMTFGQSIPTGNIRSDIMRAITYFGKPMLLSDFAQSRLLAPDTGANLLSTYSRLMVQHAAHQKMNPVPEESQ